MILALEDDFFKDWQWKYGDQFISYNWKHGELVPGAIGTIGDSDIRDGKVGSWNMGDFLDYGCKIRPLPNQKQLQYIIKQTEDVKTDIGILKQFIYWIEAKGTIILVDDITGIWLQYLKFLKGEK
jgi:hypothetical protein